jgi:hypothetical protein
MTDIVERLRSTGGKGQSGPLKAEAADEIERLREHKRLQSIDIMALGQLVYDASDPPVEWKARAEALRSELEAERSHVTRLQGALAFWMPGVSEEIETELNGRAGDDACLLAGFDGDVPEVSWGDAIRSELEALKREAVEVLKPFALDDRVAKLEKALKEQELRAQYWEKEANRAPGQMLHMTVGKDERGQQCFTHMSCEEWVSAALAATKEPKP